MHLSSGKLCGNVGAGLIVLADRQKSASRRTGGLGSERLYPYFLQYFQVSMRILPFLTAVMLIALLAACGTATEVVRMTPPATPGGRMCLNQCRTAEDFCKQGCDLEERQCITRVQQQAMQDYDQYVRAQFANHAALEFRASDFERAGGCDKVKARCTKKCDQTYQLCFQDCGGSVNVTSSCQFLCF